MVHGVWDMDEAHLMVHVGTWFMVWYMCWYIVDAWFGTGFGAWLMHDLVQVLVHY
jgi:hypothetical protein